MVKKSKNAPDSGTLLIQLRDQRGKPVNKSSRIIATEARYPNRAQYTFEGSRNEVSCELPAGAYTLQATVKGYAVGGAAGSVVAGKVTKLETCLTPTEAEYQKPSLEQRLKKYGLLVDAVELNDLEVCKFEKLRLDPSDRMCGKFFTNLQPKSVDDIKQWFGIPSDTFVHEEPAFGELPQIKFPDELLHKPNLISSEQKDALFQIAREYIHGNSKVVANYKPILDVFVLYNLGKAQVIPIFLGSTVIINEGARLLVGESSPVFFADYLKIHKRGYLQPAAQVRVDIGTYEEFE